MQPRLGYKVVTPVCANW